MADPRGKERLATVLPCMQYDDSHDPHFYEDAEQRYCWCDGMGRPEAEED